MAWTIQGTVDPQQGNQPHQHDDDGTERPPLQHLVRDELIDVGRQGFEVERPQQQGGGQLLHGFDEHQHGAGKEAAPYQRQVNATQHAARPLPQRAGRHVEAGGDLALLSTDPMAMATKRTR